MHPVLRVAVVWLASEVAGGAAASAQGRVLHEYVPNVQPHEARLQLSEGDGVRPAIVYEGELLAQPDPARAGGRSAPMQAATGDGEGREEPGRRSSLFRPDRQTQLEERLTYDAGFTPTIAPFKRLTALDQVVLDADGRTPVLQVRRPALMEIAVVGADAVPPDPRPRDRFWGEATLDFSEGRTLPLPSVAPDARILAFETQPQVSLRFHKDGADNHFVSLVGRSPSPRVRISFLTDAPRSYFGAPIPEVAADVLAAELAPMPARVREQALALNRGLGLAVRAPLPRVLHVLTAHFRSFEESPAPPEDSGDILRDLVRSQKGVCRHRSYGFVVLAQALGVPARFVQNEAHSWVEVKLPGSGWMRIDLGGAAQGLEARGADDKPVYHPAYADDLPRPAAYERSYSLLRGDVQGLRPRDVESITGRWLTRDSEADGARSEAAPVLGVALDRALARSADDGRLSLIVTVDQRRIRIERGGLMHVSGQVLGAEGLPVPRMRVELSLTARDARRTLLLGVTVSGDDGRYHAELGVPPDLPAGDYRLVVIAPGDARYAPAMAD